MVIDYSFVVQSVNWSTVNVFVIGGGGLGWRGGVGGGRLGGSDEDQDEKEEEEYIFSMKIYLRREHACNHGYNEIEQSKK